MNGVVFFASVMVCRIRNGVLRLYRLFVTLLPCDFSSHLKNRYKRYFCRSCFRDNGPVFKTLCWSIL